MTVQRGAIVGDIDRVHLDFMLSGKMEGVDLSEPGGALINLPTTATFRLRTGEGGILVTANAFHGTTAVGRGSTTGSISRGENNSIEVTLGVDVMPDGGPNEARLVLDRTSHDFGSVLKGSTSSAAVFTVTNSGSSASGVLAATLGGAQASSFSIGANSCAGVTLGPGMTCTVAVSYTPAEGQSSASLSITGSPGGTASATLAGMGVDPGALQVSPATHDFGSVVTGTPGGATIFTVTNSGGAATGNLSVALTGTDAGQYSMVSDACTGSALAGAQTCTVSVRFSPTSAGPKSATLTISASPGGGATATLMGTGLTPGALQIAPPSGDFGSILTGAQSSTQSFQVTNTGGASTTALAVALSGANSGEFAITSDGCNTMILTGGASCTITLRMAPSSAGPKAASLTVTATTGGSTAAALSGMGLAPAGLAITPMTQDFSTVVIGSNATAVLTVSNTGGVATSVPSASLGGPAAGDYTISNNGCSAAIPPTMSCQITVRFAPTATGARNATLMVTATTGGSASASLSGSGQTPGALTITPGSNDFLGVVVGQMSSEVMFTVRNTGGSPTGMLAVSKVGTTPTQFTLTSDGCNNMVLAANDTCVIRVRFTPDSVGAKSASLQVNASPGGLASASLQGSGLAPAQLGVTPSPHVFPSTAISQQSGQQAFVVSNSGGAPTGVPAVSIGGMHTADFAIDSNGCTAAIPAGGNCTVTVHFQPTTSGLRSASLSISATPGGSAAAAISGTGQTPAVVTASSASLAFGTVATGDQSGVMSFQLSNTGQQTSGGLTVTSNSAEFEIQGGVSLDCSGFAQPVTLAGGASCNVRVVFKPTMTGSRSGMVSFSASPGGSGNVNMGGTGATPSSLSLSPSTVTFGPTLVGTTVDQTVVVTNNGGTAATGLTIMLASTTDFSLSPGGAMAGDCAAGGMLAGGGGTCNVRIRYAAATRGMQSTTLTVGASGATPRMATLNGTAEIDAVLSAAVTPGTGFPSTEVGVSSASNISITLTNNGDRQSGTINVTNSNGTDFVIGTNACQGARLNAAAACSIVVTFRPSIGGARTTMIGTSATPGGTSNHTLTGTGLVRVTVTRTVAGSCASCRIDSAETPALIGCTGTGGCSALYTPGASVSLTGKQNNGSGFFFTGFVGSPCPSGARRSCAFSAGTASVTIAANFSALTGSLMFISSTVPAMNFKAIPPPVPAVPTFDQVCNSLASAAGINNMDAPNGTSYGAYYGDSAMGARARMGSTTNFLRMDGYPIAADPATLFAGNAIYPIAYDENGVLQNSWVTTGADGAGNTLGTPCSDWTNNGGTASAGYGTGGITSWSYAGISPNCNSFRIICFRKGGTGTTTAPTAPAGSLRMWTTSSAFDIGTDGTPDSFCRLATNKPANGDNQFIFAVIAMSGFPASRYINPTAMYIRPDGNMIGLGSEIIARNYTGGLWLTGPGALNTTFYMYNGAGNLSVNGTNTCTDWTNPGTAGNPPGGRAATGSGGFWSSTSVPCNAANAGLYCVETCVPGTC